MLTLLLLAFTLVVTTTAQLPPTFPSKFQATLVRNDSQSFLTSTLTELEVQLDVPHKAAYVALYDVASGSRSFLGKYWLIYRPDNAPTGSSASSSYVLFAREPQRKDGTILCTYTTTVHIGNGGFYPPVTFPEHWGVGGKAQVLDWFHYDDVTYRGNQILNSRSTQLWASSAICQIDESTPAAPCEAIYTLADKPYVYSRAHVARPNSFESTWSYTDTYSSFGDLKVKISPPDADWSTTCYNNNNGFEITPHSRAFVSTPDVMDNFTLALSSMPIPSLGPVHITFAVSINHCLNCVDIVQADGTSASTLTFTTENWDQAVPIYIKYKEEGESYIFATATGGGYSIPHAYEPDEEEFGTRNESRTISLAMRTLTCKGVAGWGCDNPDKKRSILPPKIAQY